MVIESFEDTTIRILCIAAVVSLTLGIATHGIKEGWIEGASIILAVVIVSGVTSVNNYVKEQQFRKLNAIAAKKNVDVVRAGKISSISVNDLLVGDIVKVQTGEILSVDGMVFEASRMTADESSITGESNLIPKQDFMHKANVNFALISGSKVMEGTGSMIVLAVGENTREGISKKLMVGSDDQTPLQVKLETLSNQIGELGIKSAAVTFLALFLHLLWNIIFHGQCVLCANSFNALVEYFIIAISIIVIAVPEGLPLAVTISLAYSVMKMKDENNLVRFLAACETMGGANNICTDKTGTLTQNKMTVTRLWAQQEVYVNFSESIRLNKDVKELLGYGVSLNS